MISLLKCKDSISEILDRLSDSVSEILDRLSDSVSQCYSCLYYATRYKQLQFWVNQPPGMKHILTK